MSANKKDMMDRVDMKSEFSKLSSTDQHFIKKGMVYTRPHTPTHMRVFVL